MTTITVTTAHAIRAALRARAEIALLDVRQEGPFAEGHPLFAASFPLGRLERLAWERLPRRDVPVVVYGDVDSEAEAAARVLRRLGYGDVSVLADGLAGWSAAGGELFRDVNAPSKAFGELVADTADTPSLPAREVAAMLSGARAAASVVVVDARRFDEYAVMSIPTATSVPGAELVLRVRELAPDPATTVIVNCAGRTRSIIGTQTLINAGLPNRVAALRNGTIGWSLAGLALDHGQTRQGPVVSAEASRQAAAAAWTVADRAGVRRVSEDELSARDDGSRTVYRFDVRTPPEYENGHRPGFRPAPGGQLVQETDWFAPVRGALLVLDDDGAGRAAMTASWLAQMGWDVVIATAPATTRLARGRWLPERPPAPDVTLVRPDVLAGWLRDGQARVVDVGTSREFLAGHVPGAAWALRTDLRQPGLTGRLGRLDRLVLSSPDGYLAAWAAADLGADAGAGHDGERVAVLAGGTQAWAHAGQALESGAVDGDLLSPAVDVYRRPYEGTDVDPAVMQAYLDWEYGLVGQLGRDGTHGFTVLLPG